MQQDFTPVFPRSISGKQFRLPLTHERIEGIGLRADRAYQQFSLTDAERSSLIKAYSGLKAVDRSIAADHVGDIFAVSPTLPLEPWKGDGISGEVISHNVLYCERVRVFIDALERKYLRSMPTAAQGL